MATKAKSSTGKRLPASQTSKINTTSSSIASVIDLLKARLQALERDIKADEDGKAEYDRQLLLLQMKKEDLEKRLKHNSEWAQTFDAAIGPFEANYGSLQTSISGLYGNAKDEHLKGLTLLIENFDYHPMFKRHGDSFSGVPFKPK
eukprot:GILK01005472.1.p2 GENE.GILK01005472.1~~GILK01005472.1.p2  ORF type:complete len:159 (+),score=28.99 GILK01005472.1:42-479(+)